MIVDRSESEPGFGTVEFWDEKTKLLDADKRPGYFWGVALCTPFAGCSGLRVVREVSFGCLQPAASLFFPDKSSLACNILYPAYLMADWPPYANTVAS